MTCNAVCHCYYGPLTIGRDCTIRDLGTSTALAFPYSLTQNFGFQGGSFESTIVEAGGGGIPSSLHEGWSGQTPVSSTPIFTPLPKLDSFQIQSLGANPRSLDYELYLACKDNIVSG